MSWRLAKVLEQLRKQINAAHPRRSKVSDGSIGDRSHSTRPSDHNPNAQGVVTAVDITHDPANGVDGQSLADKLITDSRTKYVIFNARIWKARTGQWEAYRSKNLHKHHVHVSVQAGVADNEAEWPLGGTLVTSPSSHPTLRRGDKGAAVALLQSKLGIEADSAFGFGTEKAVKAFQAANGLTVDGIAGPKVYEALKI